MELHLKLSIYKELTHDFYLISNHFEHKKGSLNLKDSIFLNFFFSDPNQLIGNEN